MSEVIRTVRVAEREEFERFLERCYGSERGFFSLDQPELFRDDEEAAACHLAIEKDGRIVSHVGGYPTEIVIGPARVMASGVGNVATDPDERGKGYMSRLMEESIRRWRERGCALSVLWGNRQRYGHFGYESCGLKYSVEVNRRSLERSAIRAVEVDQADAADPDVVGRIAELHATLEYRCERPQLALQLRRSGVRIFLGPDGYLLLSGDRVTEIVSPTGREPELVAGVLDWTGRGNVHVDIGPGEKARLRRLVDVMSGWHVGTQGMFRIVSWPDLLGALRPLLEHRAQGLPAFTQSIGCRWRDEIEWATITSDGHALSVEAAQGPDGVEIDLPRLTALLFGGPHAGAEELPGLARLLPVPIHIPGLDRV
jgi:predicted N-acetyltransferase YhbS